MIVVDTNIIAYLFIVSEHTEAAEDLLARDMDWQVPALWRSEMRNVLAGYIRRKSLTVEQAVQIQREAESMFFAREHAADSARVLELVAASECSAYDCEFVSLAMRLGAKLWTADQKILAAFPRHAVEISAA
ncbi:MAG: type II toxin-antitoxin system VapC family toxin [Burkholderiales bacterium]|nr:type II toxin-antitoxin system VapC family toxin [Burkholderiales bacterium]